MNLQALVLQKYEKIPKNSSSVKNIVEHFSKKDLIGQLKDFLKISRPSRMIGSVGNIAARKYIIDFVKKIDLNDNFLQVDDFVPDVQSAIQMYTNDFNREIKGKYLPQNPEYQKWDSFTRNMITVLKKHAGYSGKNIVFEKKGNISPKEVLIIGANYDTIVFDNKKMEIKEKVEMPGADNNGTGVVILLKLIELLVELDIPKTIRIVFFDFEELGFLGSRAFVNKYYKEFKTNDIKMVGFINLLMLGNDSKRFDNDKKYNNMKIYIRSENDTGYLMDLKIANYFQQIGKKIEPIIDFEIMANGFESSSQISFWEKGIPAIVYTQNWEKDFNVQRYHTENDLAETINTSTFYRAFKHITGAIIAWAFDIN